MREGSRGGVRVSEKLAVKKSALLAGPSLQKDHELIYSPKQGRGGSKKTRGAYEKSNLHYQQRILRKKSPPGSHSLLTHGLNKVKKGEIGVAAKEFKICHKEGRVARAGMPYFPRGEGVGAMKRLQASLRRIAETVFGANTEGFQ